MLDKEIVVREDAGVARRGEPVRVSVPFAKGELREPEGARLLDPGGNPAPVQFQALSRWKDGSVQWLLCDFSASVREGGEALYRLVPGAAGAASAGIEIVPGEKLWRVATGGARFEIDAGTLRPFLGVEGAGAGRLAAGGELRFALADGRELQPSVQRIVVECPGPLRATLRLDGRFGAAPGAALFSCRLHFYAQKSLCLVEFTLHNPRPARHPGGLWDLGDPGSLLFRELSFEIVLAQGGLPMLAPEAALPPVRAGGGEKLSLTQLTSGGSQRPGYRLLKGGDTLGDGGRATPVIWCGEGDSGVAALLPRFWQEFPKGVEAGPRAIKLSLFPELGGAHELQGGERKTTAFWLDFSCTPESLAPLRTPLCVLAAPAAVVASGLFPDLPAPRRDLVDRFLAGPGELVARREEIDEFGWRNFGDIFADHEAVYHRGEEPFVSHYNNQYDILSGLYRKFLATGDPLWGGLAADLARHVADIDIYHTEEDREEYNGGVFWHTDHDISAGQPTHRAFSRVHLVVKDPRFFGGGPGAEHCYTSGLLLHYYLTGDPDFRDAVLGLADWCYRSLTGPRLVLATAKKSLRYLSQLRHAKGSIFPRFPLTRGTGNAITASLDAFQLSGDRRYLERAEELVRGALHPLDDIDQRGLGNMEAAWSYTVLLGALAKFLDKKGELEERDDAFAFARASLLAYAGWMEGHEFPYLQKAEFLEYPNETWAAQELRKSVVLYHAARYAPEHRRGPYLEKARALLEAAHADLERFPTSSCTRPVALMLQNGWVERALEHDPPPADPPAALGGSFGAATPRLGTGAVLGRVCRELGDALKETTLKREIAWLRSRLG